jgi:hypothetical protein
MNFAFWLPVLWLLGIGAMLAFLGCMAMIDRYAFQPQEEAEEPTDLRNAS